MKSARNTSGVSWLQIYTNFYLMIHKGELEFHNAYPEANRAGFALTRVTGTKSKASEILYKRGEFARVKELIFLNLNRSHC